MTPLCGSCAAPLARCDRSVKANIARCSKSGTLTGSRIVTWRCSMRVAELASRRVAVWGLGREGQAAIGFLRRHHPALPLVLLDDAGDGRIADEHRDDTTCAFGSEQIVHMLQDVDV